MSKHDYILDYNDDKSLAFFNRLLLQNPQSSNRVVQSLSEHTIDDVRLLKVGDETHRGGNDMPVMGLLVKSHMSATHVDENQLSAVVRMDGQYAETQSDYQGLVDKSWYVLNHDEMAQAIQSGAYDNPQNFNRQLNSLMKGLVYERPTVVDINEVNVNVPNPENGDKGFGVTRPQKDSQLRIALVHNLDTSNYFAKDVTDNTFSYLLADQLENLQKLNATQEQFSVDRYLVTEDERQHQQMLDVDFNYLENLDAPENEDSHGLSNEYQDATLGTGVENDADTKQVTNDTKSGLVQADNSFDKRKAQKAKAKPAKYDKLKANQTQDPSLSKSPAELEEELNLNQDDPESAKNIEQPAAKDQTLSNELTTLTQELNLKHNDKGFEEEQNNKVARENNENELD